MKLEQLISKEIREDLLALRETMINESKDDIINEESKKSIIKAVEKVVNDISKLATEVSKVGVNKLPPKLKLILEELNKLSADIIKNTRQL